MMYSLERTTAVASLVGLLATGCVTQTRYVETRDALVREQAGHHETATQLQDLGERLAATERERDEAERALAERQRRIDAFQHQLAQLELQVDVAAQQREEASQLVEQLRNELARVANHLRAFSDQRDSLQTSLAAAQQKLHRLAEVEQSAAERTLVVRDLALALHEPVATGEVELVVVDGHTVVRVPTARLFSAKGVTSVNPDGDALLAAMARVAKSHPDISLQLTEVGRVEAEEDPEARLSLVSSRLVQHGVSRGKVVVAVPPPQLDEPGSSDDLTPGRLEVEILTGGS